MGTVFGERRRSVLTSGRQHEHMLYMVIETFRPGRVQALYQRFAEKGRLMPEGLRYVNSWIDEEVRRCFQVMECEQPALLQEWIRNWNDLADFEVIPVITSSQAREKVTGKR